MARVSGQTATGGQFLFNLKDNPALDYDNTSSRRTTRSDK